MKRLFFIAGILVVFTAFLLPAVQAPAANVPVNAPQIHVKEGTSTNWAGYAVETGLKNPKSGAVTDVKGSWIVPTVTGSTNAWSSIWVGIDGYSSNTVEQIGTDQNWINGNASYAAWYELYPKYPVTIPYTVKPGDKIDAEVQYVGSSFVLTLTDETGKWTFTTTQKCASAKRSSAEWIAEAPWSSGVLPLANFGTATFTNASAVINGKAGSINTWAFDCINMVNSNGGVKAQTGPLSTDGTSFGVTWLSSN